MARRIHMEQVSARTPDDIEELFGDVESLEQINLILDYARLRYNCCNNFKTPKEMNQVVAEAAQHIRKRDIATVSAGAMSGSAIDCLDLGLRLWSGCEVAEDKDAAIDWWRRIADPPHPKFMGNVSRSILTRSLSCLANAHWEKRIVDLITWNIDSVFRAASNANTCISLGLLTPAVISIGRDTQNFLKNERFASANNRRFDALKYLWEAVDKRAKEVVEEEKRRDKKVSKAQNAYVCAAQGCGIEATKKSALSRCAGKCPIEHKPSYCSKDCQKADWKRHKPFCKPNAITQPTLEKPKTEVLAPVEQENFNQGADGKERTIAMPNPIAQNEPIIMHSKSMTPAFMKEVRDSAQRELAQRQGGTSN